MTYNVGRVLRCSHDDRLHGPCDSKHLYTEYQAALCTQSSFHCQVGNRSSISFQPRSMSPFWDMSSEHEAGVLKGNLEDSQVHET
jgi:hypothetical protein